MAARPYNDPANLRENGQPKFSENAWQIYEQLREDMAEDTGWGAALAKKVSELQEEVAGLKLLLKSAPASPDIQTSLTNIANQLAALDARITALATP